MKQLVEKDGRAVITAEDGHEALSRLRSIPPPNLILLDLSMSRVNGQEFLRRKNADPTIVRIPTIVLSDVLTDLPAGAMNHLAKPIDMSRLQTLVEQYC